MKNLLILLAVILSSYSFGQVSVETAKSDSLKLKTIQFSISGTSVKSYTYTFVTGYEYPTIKEGFYAMGISTGLKELINFYTELSNLETMPDGQYALTLWTVGKAHGPIKAHKTGNIIKINNRDNRYTIATAFMEDIKADLITLQALINN
jgi:hypothetical protein